MSAKGRPTGQAAQDEVAEAQAIDTRTGQAKTTHEEGREWSPVADLDRLGETGLPLAPPPVWQRERRIKFDPVHWSGLLHPDGKQLVAAASPSQGNRDRPRRSRKLW